MSEDKLSKLQPARQTAASLRGTGAAAGSGGPTEPAPRAALPAPTLAQRAVAASAAEDAKPPPASCQQCLYVSFFFDGTGNNMKADLPTLEHSNVARMFRAHLEDKPGGVERVYIPGIGTLFPEIGDNGKGPIPVVDTHNGMGAMGQPKGDQGFSGASPSSPDR